MQPTVIFQDLGQMGYQQAWDYQEQLLRQNLDIKARHRDATGGHTPAPTTHYLLFCEHPPVYTLGKSGKPEHLLISEAEMAERGIEYFKTNRGGDITFHGPQQLVGYPILDLEHFGTDIGRYLRNLESVIMESIAHWGIAGGRSAGETGVWIAPGAPGQERKICAMGVRCSRWITMHGFALNVNTNLDYFNHIIPCGIQNKAVTSMEKETGAGVNMEDVKTVVKQKFAQVFGAVLREAAVAV
jgi:lipoyl(octanoyl) transferase